MTFITDHAPSDISDLIKTGEIKNREPEDVLELLIDMRKNSLKHKLAERDKLFYRCMKEKIILKKVFINLDLLTWTIDGKSFVLELEEDEKERRLKEVYAVIPEGFIELYRAIYVPVNPLLLATIISISIKHKKDYEDYLLKFANCSILPKVEQKLIKLEDTIEPRELSEILEIEESYINAYEKIAVRRLKKYGKLLRDSKKLSSFDIYWAAWVAANPIYLLSRIYNDYNSFFYRLYYYGKSMDAPIHSSREDYEYQIYETKNMLNDALKENYRDKIQSLRKSYDVLIRLKKRIYRLYLWLPHEITAHAAEYDFEAEYFGDESEYDLTDEVYDEIIDAWEEGGVYE